MNKEQKMTEAELVSIDEEMQQYRYEKKLSDGTTVTLFDHTKYYFNNKAMTRFGAVLVSESKDDEGKSHYSSNYEIYRDRLDQWYDWNGRKQYAERKLIEKLDNVAKTSPEAQNEPETNETAKDDTLHVEDGIVRLGARLTDTPGRV